MAQNKNQMRASAAVQAEMAEREWNNAHLRTATAEPGRPPVDAGTIGDFLSGKRWPKTGTQGRIEKALGWKPGTLNAIARGAEPPASAQPGRTSARQREREDYYAVVRASSLSERDKRILITQYDAMISEPQDPEPVDSRRLGA